MPDLDQIKQGKQEVRHRRGRFAEGRLGLPTGRPRGYRDHVNRVCPAASRREGEALTSRSGHND